MSVIKVTKQINDTTTVEVAANTVVEVFDDMAKVSDVFCVSKCGCCGGTKLTFEVFGGQEGKKPTRTIVCQNDACGAKLTIFGTNDGKKLFAAKKRQDGSLKGNDGWEVWGQQQRPAQPGQVQQPQGYEQPAFDYPSSPGDGNIPF